jgi:hypothetical protein
VDNIELEDMICTIFFTILGVLALVAGASPLGPYKISDITSSGVSSGGFMASQVHVAFSAGINGSAVFAAVSVDLQPYRLLNLLTYYFL